MLVAARACAYLCTSIAHEMAKVGDSSIMLVVTVTQQE